jgi:ferric-dicitrate binding protein FerR (iron transport regulator)
MQAAVETATAEACLPVAVNRSVKRASGAGHDRAINAAVGAGGRPLRNAASLAMTAAEVNVRVTWCGRGTSWSAEMVTARKLAGSRCSATVRDGSQAA